MTTIRQLPALGVAPAGTDVLEIQDISDTTDSADGTSKRVTVNELLSLASSNIIPVANATGVAATDGAAIQSAINSAPVGSIVRLGTGDYVIDGRACTPSTNVTLDATAASSITLATGISSGPDGFQVGLRIEGSYGTLRNLTANWDAGTDTFSVASGHGFVVNSLLKVGSDALFSANRDQHRAGQFARVVEAGTTAIKVDSAAYQDYTTADAAKAQVVTPVRGFTYIGGSCIWRTASGQRQIPMVVQAATDLTISQFHVDGVDDARNGLVLRNVRGATVSHCSISKVCDATVSTAVEGYGVWVLASEDVDVHHVHGTECRHLQDIGSYASAGQGGNVISRRILTRDCYASRCWSAGFGSHGGADDCTFDRVTTNYCGGGINVRGSNQRILNSQFIGTHNDLAPTGNSESYEHGIVVGENSSLGDDNVGPAGTNLLVDNCVVALVPLAGRSIAAFVARDPLVNATVRNCKMGGGTISVLWLQTTIDGLKVEGCELDRTGTPFGYRPAISIQPGTADAGTPSTVNTGDTFDGVAIEACRFLGMNGIAIRAFGDAAGTISVMGCTSDRATDPVLTIPAGTVSVGIVTKNYPDTAPTGTITNLVR